MKQLAVLAALLVAGLLAWNWYTTGELRLVPQSGPSSPEEARVDDLEERFEDAMRSWANAQRGTGIAGIDMTADADAAHREVLAVRGELERLIPRLDDEKLAERARKLLRKIIESERRMS